MPPKKKEPPTEAASQTTALPSQLYITRTFNKDSASDSAEDEVIAVHKFLTEPGKVSYSAGITINLGNFEFARVDIGVFIPTYREEAEEAADFAKQFVTERLEAEVEQIKNGKKKKAAAPAAEPVKKDEDPF